jgi:glycine/D-amino acid oxidase-like deaminating enzyme/nitrite reductase/ring-hydroxylating ferredoxin subunit
MDAPRAIERSPLWSEGVNLPSLPPLTQDYAVDVAVVGGGITGLTAALLLQRGGKRVAILERYGVSRGVTGRTTAHLTEALDTRYHMLTRDFGEGGARLAALGTRQAIDRIAAFVRDEKIECDYNVVPGYLFCETEDEVAALEQERDAARAAGLYVDLTRGAPLPFKVAAALRFPNQAQMQPTAYLKGLARSFQEAGGKIFEGTSVTSIEDGELCHLVTSEGTVSARAVIVAAHAPLTRVALQTKVARYNSYVIAFPGSLPRALFWDTEDPYHYIRSARIQGKDYVVIGGEDHKTGQETKTEERYEALVRYARSRFGVTSATHTWSSEVLEPVDGLPYIGKSPGQENVYVATGYSGNGITFGTLAGIMLDQAVRGQDHPLALLLAPSRFKPLASAHDYLTENIDFPLHFVGDRLKPADASSVEEVGRGEGKLVRCGAEKLAVYRDANGKVHALSPVCTHLGGHVHWNSAEKSWDCPCHGARFGIDGSVLHGPALTPLECKKLA